MPTITQLYEDYDTKQATIIVHIGGIRLVEVLSAEWHFAFEQVPTASVRVPNPPPVSATYLASATIDVGFNGITIRAFTGHFLEPEYDEEGCVLNLIGKSWLLDVNYHKVVVDVDGVKTADQLVEELLDAAGIANYNVVVPAWTPGTNAPQSLEFSTYSEAIKKIAEVDGCRWWETPTGTVVVKRADPIPGSTSWRDYFSMQLTGPTESYPSDIAAHRPRLRRSNGTYDVRATKNQVFVSGATYTQTNADNSESNIEVEADAKGASPWVRNWDGSQAYNDELFSNELIDTAVKAAEVAGRLITLKNRLWTTLNIEVVGDPQVSLGKTCRIEDPDYSSASGRWFLENYTTRIDSNDFSTQMTMLGGMLGGKGGSGSQSNIAPFALFTWAIDYEVMGNAVWAVVTLDGSGSFDADGTIASWAWTDNQAPPVAVGAGEKLTIRIDPATYVSPWEVTLTVTDNDGDTDSITLEIVPEAGYPGVGIPSLFVAADSWFSATPDGGMNWNNQAGVGVRSVGCDLLNAGVACYGTTTGAIYRTTDFCNTALTLVMTACGHEIVDIKWDRNISNNVWALSINGLLFRSEDNGVTWYLYEDLAAKFGLGGIICNHIATPPPNNVWIFGGTGTGWPLICFELGRTHNWGAPVIGGELAADLATFGYPNDVYIAQAYSGYFGQLAIILNSAAMTTAVFWTDDIHGDGSAWKRAVGLPAKSRGQWLIGNGIIDEFSFGYNDTVIYTGAIAAGVMNVAVAAAALDAGHVCEWGMDLSPYLFGLSDVHLLAVRDTAGVTDGLVYKTFDRFATIDKMWPAAGFPVPPVGARAYQIEASVQTSEGSLAGKVLIAGATDNVGANPFASHRQNDTTWDTDLLAGSGAANSHRFIIRALTPSLWFVRSDPVAGNDETLRTKDGGANWAILALADATYIWQDFAVDANGRLWGLAMSTTNPWGDIKIYYSDDSGDTWTCVYTLIGLAATNQRMRRLACHPSDANIIVAVGAGSAGASANRPITIYTTDGGTGWTRNVDLASGIRFDYLNICDIKVTADGRIVAAGRLYSGAGIDGKGVCTTDDYGVGWTQAFGLATAGNWGIRGPVGTSTGSLLFVLVGSIGALPYEGRIYRSINGGVDWIEFGPAIPQQDTTDWGAGGIAYDELNDALITMEDAGALGPATTNTWLVCKLSPVAEDSDWQEFSDTLLPINAVQDIYISSGEDRIQVAIIPQG